MEDMEDIEVKINDRKVGQLFYEKEKKSVWFQLHSKL